MNELLFVISLVCCMAGVHISHRFFGKAGVLCWIVFATILANMEVLKTVNMFGMELTLGNATFGTVYLATDILSELYSKKDALKAVYISFFCSLCFVILTQIDLLIIPSDTDFAHSAFETIFGMIPRACLGSMIAYITGNLLDILIYEKLKIRDGNKRMWLRNNLCTMLAQLIDNFVLYLILYYGVLPIKNIIAISFGTWAIEVIVALADTPVLYYTKHVAIKKAGKTV